MYARETSPLNQKKLEKPVSPPKKERKKWNVLENYKQNLSNSRVNTSNSFTKPINISTSFRNQKFLTADEQKKGLNSDIEYLLSMISDRSRTQ
jgi:hypothetical protein